MAVGNLDISKDSKGNKISAAVQKNLKKLISEDRKQSYSTYEERFLEIKINTRC